MKSVTYGQTSERTHTQNYLKDKTYYQSLPVFSLNLDSDLVICERLSWVKIEAENAVSPLKDNDLVPFVLGRHIGGLLVEPALLLLHVVHSRIKLI